jgi:hypothetical protein
MNMPGISNIEIYLHVFYLQGQGTASIKGKSRERKERYSIYHIHVGCGYHLQSHQ